jgi:hypothetical protein
MSRVFLAEETRLSRQVVIKVLRLGELHEPRGDRCRAADYYNWFVALARESAG